MSVLRPGLERAARALAYRAPLRLVYKRRMRLRSCVLLALSVAVSCSAHEAHKRPDASSLSPQVSFGAVWDDPLRCAETVRTGLRLRRPLDAFRVGTWNVKWFPDGKPGHDPDVSKTNVPWLACAISYLDVDVLGLQEIKLTERGRDALRKLTSELKAFTGADWQWNADGCKTDALQHVVLLHRTDRAALTEVLSDGSIDPTARKGRDPACPGGLRPALGAYVRSLAGGVDFHIATTHFDSGRTKRDYDNRIKAWALVDQVQTHRVERVADDDFILVADFNLMGREGGDVADADGERALLDQAFAALPRPLKLGAPSHPCTHYYKGAPSIIDQIAISKGMREAAGATEIVSGVCGAAACKPLPENLPAFEHLSDHCPVVLDIRDTDLDDDPAALSGTAEPPIAVPAEQAVAP